MLYKGNRSAGPVYWCVLLGLVTALLIPAGLAQAVGNGQPPTGAETDRVRDDEPERDEPREQDDRRQRPPDEFIERFRNEEDIRELIEVVRVWRMSRELDLSEEQALKRLMLADKYREADRQMQKEEDRAIDELRDALDEGKSGSEIEALIERLDKIDARMVRAEREYHKQLLEGLSPEQKAMMYVFRRRFERDVRDTIRYIMERRREEREDDGDNDRGRGRNGSRRE